MNLLLSTSLFIGIGSICLATEPGKKPDTPKQPWSDYVVHDGPRPTPEKVKTQGAVTTPAPADATVLFDGKDTSAFTKAWKVVDGSLVASPGDNHTKQSFGDCQLHVEWKIPTGRKIKNQKGGNSGIFLMDKYEVQVQESHTNVTYADGQAGALYGQTPPVVNASTAQGEWQSYDIVFTAPKYAEGKLVSPAFVTVIHNGVVIHNHQNFYGPTVYKSLAKYPKSHPEKAPIRLQWHNDPIEFRNIWIRNL